MTWDEFELVICPNCALPFGATKVLLNLRRKDHSRFYCPNGHALHFSVPLDLPKDKQADSELEQLRKMTGL